MGRQPDGSEVYLTGLGLMHEDPLSFFTPADPSQGLLEIASRMHPIPKAFAELAVGESFFQKGQIGRAHV